MAVKSCEDESKQESLRFTRLIQFRRGSQYSTESKRSFNIGWSPVASQLACKNIAVKSEWEETSERVCTKERERKWRHLFASQTHVQLSVLASRVTNVELLTVKPFSSLHVVVERVYRLFMIIFYNFHISLTSNDWYFTRTFLFCGSMFTGSERCFKEYILEKFLYLWDH